MDQYEQLWEEMGRLGKKVEDQTAKWFEWAEVQDVKRGDFEDKILSKLDGLKDALSQKTEMDSAMISQLSELRKRVDTEEQKRGQCDQVIYETSFQVKALVDRLKRHDLSKMEADINTAHDKYRDHEERLRPLEKREGKLARSILEKMALALIAAGAGYFISWLVGK